jgi:hypothetical protein
MENTGRPMGLRFHTKGPLRKTEVCPMDLHFFLEGTFVETGGGPIDLCFHTKDLPGK